MKSEEIILMKSLLVWFLGKCATNEEEKVKYKQNEFLLHFCRNSVFFKGISPEIHKSKKSIQLRPI